MVEYLPTVHEALGSIPRTTERKRCFRLPCAWKVKRPPNQVKEIEMCTASKPPQEDSGWRSWLQMTRGEAERHCRDRFMVVMNEVKGRGKAVLVKMPGRRKSHSQEPEVGHD